MDINNSLNATKINGDFIGGNQYNRYYIPQKEIVDIFNVKIFLHYAGYKISKLLCGKNANNDFFTKNTKIILLLFDNIVISFSDVIQSCFVYDNPFFYKMLQKQHEGNYNISIIGPSSNSELEATLEEREKFYSKPGFYNIMSMSNHSDFLTEVKKSIITKCFSTRNILEYQWQQDFIPISDNTIKISDIKNNKIKNLVLQNTSYFYSNKIEEFITLPKSLNDFPFIWDSVKYLKLVSHNFDTRSVANIDDYIASEWIKCYIENHDVVIPNGLLDINDCSLGLSNVVDLRYIIHFLRKYKLLYYVLCLDFENLMKVRYLYSSYIRCVINKVRTNDFCHKKPGILEENIEKIHNSNKSYCEKIKDIVHYLCDYV